RDEQKRGQRTPTGHLHHVVSRRIVVQSEVRFGPGIFAQRRRQRGNPCESLSGYRVRGGLSGCNGQAEPDTVMAGSGIPPHITTYAVRANAKTRWPSGARGANLSSQSRRILHKTVEKCT